MLDRSIVAVTVLRGGSPTEVDGYTLGVPLGPGGAAALEVSFVHPQDEGVRDGETPE